MHLTLLEPLHLFTRSQNCGRLPRPSTTALISLHKSLHHASAPLATPANISTQPISTAYVSIASMPFPMAGRYPWKPLPWSPYYTIHNPPAHVVNHYYVYYTTTQEQISELAFQQEVARLKVVMRALDRVLESMEYVTHSTFYRWHANVKPI
jgi:hypothetical protein